MSSRLRATRGREQVRLCPICCCACTCQDTADNSCGGLGFVCIDPEAPCVEDDDVTVDMVENCFPYSIGDGYCHQENNNQACGTSLNLKRLLVICTYGHIFYPGPELRPREFMRSVQAPNGTVNKKHHTNVFYALDQCCVSTENTSLCCRNFG